MSKKQKPAKTKATAKSNNKKVTSAKAEKYDHENSIHDVDLVDGLYKNWFLEYASYVILERAVPRIEDGLKPVQRRIMHSLKEMDDGRFNKVANVIGNTMQYHPHGDAAIAEAIVNIGQKDILIETQGNWGDIRTGDSSAAPRYIEARLSKFALDVVYNPQTTEWQLSYDGRKREPVTLPVKFPLLLAQGVEGIAVGLSTKILPHNFCELIKASIDVLKGKNPKIYPDFPTGGYMDTSEYNQGLRGGRIKVRARVEILDKKTLIIKDIPFGITTTSLMESIVKASEKGKIKVKQVIDNTAKDVEILVHLHAGQSPEIALDALYAFTDCEVSISPNACVIVADKPKFMSVNEILKYNTAQTQELLRRELEIRKHELMEKILFSSLEKIFIEKRIYRNIEECETWDAVIKTIDKGLGPYKKQFYREITVDDIVRLTEIKIKRISKFDAFKANEILKGLEDELKQTKHHLKHLVEYAISYYQNLLDKYGKGRERKTEIRNFQSVTAVEVIAANAKLYVNRVDGFAGWGLKRDEFVADCSELDDIIVIRKDGKALVSRIADKVFMGKDILHIGVWKKGDDRMVYNMIYSDGKTGKSFVKRFAITAVTRDKPYDLTQGDPNSKVHYLSANPNGEAEVVEVKLNPSSSARKKIFEFDFSSLEIKGRGSRGNTLTKYPIKKVDLLESGVSTLSGLDLWYDVSSGRLNRDQRGKYLGKFDGDDQLIAFYRNGAYKITTYELTNRYEPERIINIEKFNPKKPVSAIYVDGDSKQHFVKRFLVETQTLDKEFVFISEAIGSRLELATGKPNMEVDIELNKGKGKEKVVENESLDDLIDVKGWKALGNKLSSHKVHKIKLVEEEVENIETEEEEVSTTSNPRTASSADLKKKEQELWDNEAEQKPKPQQNQSEQQEKSQPAKQKPKEKPRQKSQSKKQNQKSSQNPSAQPSLFEAEQEKESLKKESEGKAEEGFTIGDTVEW